MTVVLEGMSPAQEQGWLVLLDLFPNRRTDWTLIGGQMMYILAAEHGVTMPRATTDMDVVINVVESPGATRALAPQLLQQGFEFGDVSPAGTGGIINGTAKLDTDTYRTPTGRPTARLLRLVCPPPPGLSGLCRRAVADLAEGRLAR